MMRISGTVREFGRRASCMEEVAEQLVRFFYEEFHEPDGHGSCALVRLYKTHPLGKLEPSLRAFATSFSTGSLSDSTLCLTLMATAGDRPEWNDRTKSKGHKAIPLPSPQALARLPMVSQLFAQMGIHMGELLQPDRSLLLDPGQRTYNVFHIENAVGSSYIPDQREFVIPCGIESVVGFGGLLTSAVFAVIMFAKTKVTREKAQLFRSIALSVKLALLPFSDGPVFWTEFRGK
jgi:hypothetical protein